VTPEVDLVVVGAGIVGLATAVEAQRRRPGRSVVVLDKEAGVARHQTGRNSGVVHSGLYYRPGSAKARWVAAARSSLERYCRERELPFERTGKLVVATHADQLGPLEQLRRRGLANGLAVERVDARRRHELEPHVDGLAALWVPETAICDFGAVAASLADDLVAAGGELLLGRRLESVEASDGVVRLSGTGASSGWTMRARQLVNCAGLHSDRVARMAGARTDVRIVPFRGEYHELSPGAEHLVRGLVYPVPDPRWPFLGVHLTRMVHGGVHVGPNAVLALGREAYSGGLGDAGSGDLRSLVGDPGLRRLAVRYWRTGAEELVRSRSRRLLLRDVQRLVPEVGTDDLRPAPSGIRAQALDASGRLLDDFELTTSTGCVHVLNAPSPAATASFAIAREVVDRLPDP
jgi:L-2-hydroxyglutarate oxidase